MVRIGRCPMGLLVLSWAGFAAGCAFVPPFVAPVLPSEVEYVVNDPEPVEAYQRFDCPE